MANKCPSCKASQPRLLAPATCPGVTHRDLGSQGVGPGSRGTRGGRRHAAVTLPGESRRQSLLDDGRNVAGVGPGGNGSSCQQSRCDAAAAKEASAGLPSSLATGIVPGMTLVIGIQRRQGQGGSFTPAGRSLHLSDSCWREARLCTSAGL